MFDNNDNFGTNGGASFEAKEEVKKPKKTAFEKEEEALEKELKVLEEKMKAEKEKLKEKRKALDAKRDKELVKAVRTWHAGSDNIYELEAILLGILGNR